MSDYESVFNDSFQRILNSSEGGEVFFGDFYDQFIASSPEVAEKFSNTDMARQHRMLKESFYNLLSFSVFKEVPESLERVAATHSQASYDIRPALYDLWLECLISAVKTHDAKFSDEVELAWRLAMAKGITYMKFKYAHQGSQ